MWCKGCTPRAERGGWRSNRQQWNVREIPKNFSGWLIDSSGYILWGSVGEVGRPQHLYVVIACVNQPGTKTFGFVAQ